MYGQVTRRIRANAILRRCLSASPTVRSREVRHRISLVVVIVAKEMTNYHGWIVVPFFLRIAASRAVHSLHENGLWLIRGTLALAVDDSREIPSHAWRSTFTRLEKEFTRNT